MEKKNNEAYNNERACGQWSHGIVYDYIIKGDDGEFFLTSDEWGVIWIEYCPFCGSKLDEKGCTGNREIDVDIDINVTGISDEHFERISTEVMKRMKKEYEVMKHG